MLNPFPPPSLAFFRGLSAHGPAVPLILDIGGWSYRFAGMDPSLRTQLEERYRAFLEETPGQGAFSIGVLDGAVEHFVPPERESRDGPHPLSLGWEGAALLVRSFGFAAWIDLEKETGEMALARREYERWHWGVENLLRVTTAWRAAAEGGVLLHAAGILRDGLAYLFMGASGSGKSTLARTSREGKVLSDDLILIRKGREGYRAVGTPFRGTYAGGSPIRGEFPIAGIYRIFPSGENRVEACPPAHAVADLLAAAPFVVDQVAHDPGILERLRSLANRHPPAYLHFTREGDFWDLLPEGR